MNRRIFLILSAVLPTSFLSRLDAGEIIHKDYEEYDFEFEGIRCTYFVIPTSRVACFVTSQGVECLVPNFDLRDFNNSLEEQIRLAVQSFRDQENKSNKIHCNIYQYKGFDTHIGICMGQEKFTVKIDYSPEDTVDRRRRMLTSRLGKDCIIEGRWGEPVGISSRTQQEIDDQVSAFSRVVQNNNHIVDDAGKFFRRVKNFG